MRVLTALTYYAPHWTGLTLYAQRIAEGLADRGHDVTVLCTHHDPALPRTERLGGVDVVRVPTFGRVSRGPIAPSLLPTARRLLADHDVLHVHSPMPESGPLVALARRAGRASLVTHQGDVVMPAGLGNRLVQAAMHATSVSAVRRADAVITHAADYAAHSRLLAERARPVGAIPPPTVLPPPDPASVARWRTELGLDGRRVIGFAGRFVEEKGFDRLLEAFGAIRDAVPDAHLLFAGEVDVVYERFHDRCRPLLDRHAGAVTSLGLVLDRRRLADFYALCDVFVLPSRSDCFAAVQVEALLSGTPLVTADIPGAREVVRTTGMGRLFDSDDTAALAEAIVTELRDPRPRPERAAVLAHYDAEVAVDRYEAVAVALAEGREPDVPGPAGAGAGAATGPDPRWALRPDDRAAVERALANETDMAFHRRVPRLFELLDLCPGDVVLDGGCGMGVLARVLARTFPVRVLATDVDRDRLAWAASEGVGCLVAADLARLPLPDASVDRVLLAEVLEHVDDDVAALREVRRALRPGGVVAISVPHANYPLAWDPLGRLIDAAGGTPITDGPITGQWSGHRRLYLPADLHRALVTAGFEVDAVEAQTAHVAPLTHLLTYTIGKPLLERGLLPARVARSADRFRGEDNTGSGRNPLEAYRRLLRRHDRRNDALRGDETRFVGLVARATRPA